MEGGIIETPDTTRSASSYEDVADYNACCHPKGKPWRFLGLAFMCLLGFGSYFCFDNPAALQDYFKDDLGMSTSQFVLLYSIYSWPNVVFCFIGGFLLDSIFGIRLGTIIYMGLALAGQLLFATGAIFNAFWVMMIGRLIFGIGCESLAVAQNSYAVLWFKGRELNMVFGLQLSFARVGSTVNFIVMEPIYAYVGTMYSGAERIGVVLFLAALTCVFSMLCAIFLGLMDRRTEKLTQRGHGDEKEVVRLTDVKYFKGIFWLVVLICVAYYVAIFPFIALGKVYFMRKYDYEAARANAVNSLLYLVSAIASPIFGLAIDKVGKNVLWVFLSIIGTIMAHGMLAFTYISPYTCMIIMGLSYSVLASALWPLICLVIPEYQLGTAYGIAQAAQNLGLAVVSIIAGSIVDKGGYLMLEIFFLGWLWISLVTSVIIWVKDLSATGGYLNMTPKQREVYDASRPTADRLEREKLLTNESTSDLSTDDLLQPQSDISIRNRYLARIGAPLPAPVKATAYRALR